MELQRPCIDDQLLGEHGGFPISDHPVIDRQNIVLGTLTLHSDCGTSERPKSVGQLLVDLDVTKTHSRAPVSDDNPYSEVQFKTLKYRPDFPTRFGSIEDASAQCREFFIGTTGTSSLRYGIDAVQARFTIADRLRLPYNAASR